MKPITHRALVIFLIIECSCLHNVLSRKLISSTIRVVSTESPLAPTFNSQFNLNSTTNEKTSTAEVNTPPKTMHRLVGGHLHHSVYRKEENNFSSQSPSRLSKLYFRRKPWPTSTSSTLPTLYGSTQPTTASSAAFSLATESLSTLSPSITTSSREHATATSAEPTTTTKEPVFIVEAQRYEDPEYEANQVINYEIKKEGFVESSAGEGKDDKKKDESKKTLSDQVAEGKYGLIQNELFKTPIKRPGILSYATNPETPNDNASNLGGLSKDEIWLSEDHLLVLKGGSLNTETREEPWKPIDDYQAPLRQVKIPDNPKVPPPFLVQLEENGPIEFIGNNQLPLVNPFTNESLLLFPDGGFPKTETYSGDKTYLYARPPGTTNDAKNVNAPPVSLGNHRNNNFTFTNPFISPGQLPFPPPPPSLFGMPFLNGSLDNANFTDGFDEDDPSFYYPPPYSFVYNSNYTNPVAPGPLVPGIILPPPPNFFGRLEDRTTTTTTTTMRPTTSSTQKPYKQVLRPVYRPTTTTTTSIPSTQIPTHKTIKAHKVQTEAFRQNVLSPTRLPTPSTTQKPVTQLKQINGQDILAFVPKEAILNDPLSNSKGKPIYYEYFDARIKANVKGPTYIITTTAPPSTVRTLTQQQKQSTRIQLHPSAKQLRRPSNSYLPVVKPPSDYGKYVVITPKPEGKPISSNTVQVGDSQSSYKSNLNPPSKSYNSEIDNIRHTIEFFKNQQKLKPNDTNLPRNPKGKAVYEYSFDATPTKGNSKLFHPPSEFDSSPFKPMVQYSLPLNADNGFKAITYSTIPGAATEATTTTTSAPPPSPSSPLPPLSTLSNLRYIPTLNENVSKKPHVSFIPFDSGSLKPNSLKHSEYSTVSPVSLTVTTPLPPLTTIQPWISVEKQILREVRPKEINVQIQSHSPSSRPLSLLRGITAPYESSYVDANANDGHYNNQIFYPIRTPSTYYQQQTRQPVMTAQQNAYLRQVDFIRHQIQQFPNQYRINVANNTIPSQNYRVARPLPTQNNFITSYHHDFNVDSNRYPHLSQILSPNYNIPPQPQPQRLPHAIHPLHRDVIVNYKYPLPPINPDSEFLPPPHLLHPLPPAVPSSPSIPYNRYGRIIRKPPTVVQYKLPGDNQQSGVFFYTPAEDKYGNANKK
ncbi:uncharacterized protein LOC116343298 [Contarinia nasturtii]|uniref:uncharacterized protein LOC116343298 n=1 Tax=Contarinia nasturtii TaxID=265458 RepID=UPI0012D4A411|nr:uncharacterized protein LOC116343298 [Contarinia nasturtii]XP_031627146.1 uncharacterized protein LOC116343298 [Contarinia nasturtii]XP_031627147.1 uncharacterized protein LOC116343298 [Contarinia nasturtii]XP_031627148.1 uncharacterized protein LOC116343298 [Contarinia nasturtii]XP_031627149.1 uncharacterized protein LOC116343298 [Contarinia nasturtii]XP_031627151.1 uncharacterized protein LOC116343298 [Contarinia nasturtii]